MSVVLVLWPLLKKWPHEVPWTRLAYYRRLQDGSGVIYVRQPFHFIFYALQRLAHELAHHDDLGSQDHHPWQEFCIRSPGALRFGWLHATRSKAQVRAFRQDRRLD